MSETISVYDGPETTSFGIFGTSPESPDGKRLYFWEAVAEDKVEARFADLTPYTH
tara:strand:+ start:368 stop:532 length:165 start_codon:yes stop_codon:yes gene_type:complete